MNSAVFIHALRIDESFLTTLSLNVKRIFPKTKGFATVKKDKFETTTLTILTLFLLTFTTTTIAFTPLFPY